LNTEPLENKKIASYAKDKGITFPVFGKVNVNGSDTSPLYEWLKEKAPGMITDTVKWNFTKFLVVNGVPKKRYAPQDAPRLLEDDIVQAILDVGSTKMDSPITKVDKTDLDFPNKEKAPTAGGEVLTQFSP
jgi:glutathione peroxidase-family protein